MANLLAELAAALAYGGVETPAEGWLTAEQHAAAAGLSRGHAAHLLRSGIASGLVECRKFRIATGGKLYPVPHYKRRP